MYGEDIEFSMKMRFRTLYPEVPLISSEILDPEFGPKPMSPEKLWAPMFVENVDVSCTSTAIEMVRNLNEAERDVYRTI